MGALDGIYEAISDLTREAIELEARLADVVSSRDHLTQIVEVLSNPQRAVTVPSVAPAEPEPAKPKRIYKQRDRPERRTGNRPGPVSDKPDYPQIAEFVKKLLASSPRAAVGPAIAGEFEVPLTTAKNWMNRCRQLGLIDVPLTTGPAPANQPPESPKRANGGPRKYDLDEVTEIANQAINTGVSMRALIARHLDITEVHAGSLIQDARRAGKQIARQSSGRKQPLTPTAAVSRAPRRTADEVLGTVLTQKGPVDYGNLPSDIYVFVADYLDCIRAGTKPLDTLSAKYLCDRQAVQKALTSARVSQLLPPANQPQLPEEERRVLLNEFKPEPVP